MSPAGDTTPSAPADAKALPRGFRQGWSKTQLQNICNWFTQRQPQQHRQQQEQRESDTSASGGESDYVGDPGAFNDKNADDADHVSERLMERDELPLMSSGDNGDSSSPGFLPPEALIEMDLGIPDGGDVDPILTGIFEVKLVLRIDSVWGRVSVW